MDIKAAAVDLLTGIWRMIPAEYKSRYRMSIWQQFEDRVRSAAYTNSLGKFVNSLCSSLQAAPGANAEERVKLEAILNSGHDRELLKLLREQTTLIVLMVRVANQERRDAFLASMEEQDDENLGV